MRSRIQWTRRGAGADRVRDGVLVPRVGGQGDRLRLAYSNSEGYHVFETVCVDACAAHGFQRTRSGHFTSNGEVRYSIADEVESTCASAFDNGRSAW